MQSTVVGVLRGGPSGEHDVSLATGAAMLANLPAEHYTLRDIYIDKHGVWNERGRASTPADILRTLDAALIGLHGAYGEDGEMQRLLERAGVPYAGSDSFASFLALHKVLAKEKAREAGLRTPAYRFIQRPEDAEAAIAEAVRTFMPPVVVKPVRWGSSIGVSLASGYAPLYEAVNDLFARGAEGVLLEEYIRGTEVTVGIVENIRGEKLYALPAVEIRPDPQFAFYDYAAKYHGGTRLIAPGNLSRKIKEELASAARIVHETLGLRHYSRSDFIVTPRGVYYLETNSLPALGSERAFTVAADAVGISGPDLLSHLAGLALAK